jgi:catalase (peroxidase I)
MLTTDLSLRFDPAYEKISRRFLENPEPSSPTPSPAPGSS